jgi:hypothetical protein
MATPPGKKGLIPAERTTSIFSSHVQQRDLSRERIAEDMAAFNKAGGQIEVLGNTPFRTKPSPENPLPPAASRPLRTGMGPKSPDRTSASNATGRTAHAVMGPARITRTMIRPPHAERPASARCLGLAGSAPGIDAVHCAR